MNVENENKKEERKLYIRGKRICTFRPVWGRSTDRPRNVRQPSHDWASLSRVSRLLLLLLLLSPNTPSTEMPMDHRQQSSHVPDGMHSDDLSNVLKDVHAQNMVTFQRILAAGRLTSTEERAATGRFWDIVVITAGDLQQRLCYQRQIDLKLAKEQIPRQAQYVKYLLEQTRQRGGSIAYTSILP